MGERLVEQPKFKTGDSVIIEGDPTNYTFVGTSQSGLAVVTFVRPPSDQSSQPVGNRTVPLASLKPRSSLLFRK